MPWLYTEAQDGLFAIVNAQCDQVEAATGIRCSPHMRALVVNTLSAVVEDPSPTWRAGAQERQRRLAQLVETLPQTLITLVKSASIEGRLSYFDTLHWLTARLDTICPFDKDRRRHRG